jgi:hypothetical protein
MADTGSAFRDALSRFRANLDARQQQDFENCNLQDVQDAIEAIQHHWASKRKQRSMKRISKFLEGMEQLSKVIEVFLNVDSTVAFVWAPVKFALLAAGTWVETLDCLLDTYEEIGEVLPGLQQYGRLLRKHRPLQTHIENYYCDVLEFHGKAMDVFGRPGTFGLPIIDNDFVLTEL